MPVEMHVKFQAPLASPITNKGKRPSPSLSVSNHVSQRSQFQLSMSWPVSQSSLYWTM
jgi:hypothetical protein